MTVRRTKFSTKRPKFNLHEQPAAEATLDMKKQAQYVLARKQETLNSKKVDWAKLRQIVINR